MASVTDKTARKTFKVSKRGSSYDVECLLCGKEFKAWYWLRNALARGYAHSWASHSIESPRGKWIVATRWFADEEPGLNQVSR